MITLAVTNFINTSNVPATWSAVINETIAMPEPIPISEAWEVTVPSTPVSITFHYYRANGTEISGINDYNSITFEDGKNYVFDWWNETFTAVPSGGGDEGEVSSSSLNTMVIAGMGILGLLALIFTGRRRK